MKEEWLFPGAVVPVDVNTTAALVAEIKRLIGVVGGMALDKQRPWVGLDEEEIKSAPHHMVDGAYHYSFKQGAKWAETKLKEKNQCT